MIESWLEERIQVDAERILQQVVPMLTAAGVPRSVFPALIAKAIPPAIEDLEALTYRDAAASASPAYVYESYLSFRAVLAYRIAHLIYRLHPGFLVTVASAHVIASAARRVTESAKVETGVDIHPAANIGRRFVIDHGNGTVIGEQVEIGNDCYLLQNVVLGGRSIGYSSKLTGSRRHPRIGSRVEIGADVKVLGPVTVGDDCCLEPGARVTSDIPPNSRVRVISTLQITVADRSPEIHGIAFILDELLLSGARLTGCLPALIDGQYNLLRLLPIHSCSDTHIRCRMPVQVSSQIVAIGIVAHDTVIGYITPISAFRRVTLSSS